MTKPPKSLPDEPFAASPQFRGPMSLRLLLSSDVVDHWTSDQVADILQAARTVIGGTLRQGTLDRDTLKRMQASVLRQKEDARRLRAKLPPAAPHVGPLEEIDRFFQEALSEIERQISKAQ